MNLGRCVMAVHAHPDDESILTGGLLAHCSATGVRSVVVTCTGGGLSVPRAPIRGSQEAVRARELAAALAILGVSRHVQLGFQDSGMAGAPENDDPLAFHQVPLQAAAEQLVALMREEQPDTVITYDAKGGYGHPDHIKAHDVTVSAFRQAHLPRSALYAVVFPRRWLRHFVQVLASAGIQAYPPALLGIDDLAANDEFGVPDGQEVEALDVADHAATKRAAIAAHQSQMGTDHVLVRIPAGLWKDIWQWEYFQRLA